MNVAAHRGVRMSFTEPDTPTNPAVDAQFHVELRAAQADAARDSAALLLLCRNPDAPPGELRRAAQAVLSSAGRLAGFAGLLSR